MAQVHPSSFLVLHPLPNPSNAGRRQAGVGVGRAVRKPSRAVSVLAGLSVGRVVVGMPVLPPSSSGDSRCQHGAGQAGPTALSVHGGRPAFHSAPAMCAARTMTEGWPGGNVLPQGHMSCGCSWVLQMRWAEFSLDSSLVGRRLLTSKVTGGPGA